MFNQMVVTLIFSYQKTCENVGKDTKIIIKKWKTN